MQDVARRRETGRSDLSRRGSAALRRHNDQDARCGDYPRTLSSPPNRFADYGNETGVDGLSNALIYLPSPTGQPPDSAFGPTIAIM
jgi:hypothetical protein